MKIRVNFEWNVPDWVKHGLRIGLPLVVVAGGVAVAWASGITTFKSGETLSASSMNDNFQALQDQIAARPASALRAAYDFEEGSGTTSADSSGFGADLTLNSSGVSWTTAGHTGNALNFDGASGFATSGNNAALNPRQEITVSAWVYQTAGAAATACVVNKPGQYALAVVNGSVQFAVQTVKGPAAVFNGSGALPAVTAPAWTHIMASYDGETIRTFVNGFLTDHADYPYGLLAESTSALHIGDCLDSSNHDTGFFTGKIDEVRIGSIARTSTQFRNIARWQGYATDGVDNGAITCGTQPACRTLSYSKKAPGTGLRVIWSDNFRATNNTSSCRWEVLFNGAPCTSPGGLVFDKYEGGTSSNRHDPVTVTGTCYGLGGGLVTVSTRVISPVPGTGHPTGDCNTGGFSNQLASIEVEEVP